MKTILAATDFSPAAQDASRYAAELARSMDARLFMYSAYQQVPVPVVEAPVLVTPGDMRQLAEQELQREVELVDPGHRVVEDVVVSEGPPAGEILKYAAQIKADLIIAGMKSEGKGIRRVIGSTVGELARRSTVPVIIVPEKSRFSGMFAVALATETDLAVDADPHVLDTLKELLSKFNPRLYLVRMAKNQFREAFEVLNRPFRIMRMLRTADPVYECIEGKNLPNALNEFVRSFKIDLLAIMPHKHPLLQRLFSGSSTRSMIFETEVPLLILPEHSIPKAKEHWEQIIL